MTSYSVSPRDMLVALSNWRSVIGLMITQEIGWRFRNSPVGAVLAFAEPFVVVVGIITIRSFIIPNAINALGYGQSALVFISSGVFPYYLFLRLSIRSRTVGGSKKLPWASWMDVVVASAATELSLYLGTMLTWFVGLSLAGYTEAEPHAIGSCIAALFFLAVLGVGVGLLNSVLIKYVPIWSLVYNLKTRGLIFFSGVFYMVSYLPYNSRNYIVWNPIAHGIEWFRVGLYGHYPTAVLDREYLAVCAGAALFVGLLAYRAASRPK